MVVMSFHFCRNQLNPSIIEAIFLGQNAPHPFSAVLSQTSWLNGEGIPLPIPVPTMLPEPFENTRSYSSWCQLYYGP